ncbi:MAG: hypothetical protein GKR93_09355 [Gammaproteobacteria bacterium]|nr:hypothetical protein [Gammaproteobacteria bacterium]
MLSFALTHYFSGLDPFSFKLWNLIIHLLNGVCIYSLTRYILIAIGSRIQETLTEAHIYWVSLFTSACWLLHPINFTSVIYASQRMTSLASLFVFLGLIFFIRGRLRLEQGHQGRLSIALGFFVITPLAILSKENGALLIYYFLIIEYFIFKLSTRRAIDRKLLLICYFPIGLSVIAALLFILLNPEWLSIEYLRRNFTVSERLLTESRVIFFYLKLILIPDVTAMGLFHDDFVISRGLFSPLSTIPALAGIVVLVFVSLLVRKKAPMLGLGLALFFAGHSMESTFLSLELVFEHRNYFPAYWILLILVYYALHPFLKLKYFALRRIFITLFAVNVAFQTYVQSNNWRDLATYIVINAQHHPLSARSIDSLGQLYADLALNSVEKATRQQYIDLARSNFERASKLAPDSVAGLLNALVLNSRLGERTSEKLLGNLNARLRVIPLSDNTSNQIAGFEKRCNKLGVCNISQTELRSLFDSVLANSSLTRRARAQIIMAYAEHYILSESDLLKALDLVLSAKQINPKNPYISISAIRLYIALEQKDKAFILLEETRASDIWNIQSERLQELEDRIAVLN